MIRDRIVCKICGGWKDIDPATGEAMSCDTCDDVADEQRSEEHTSELQSQSNLVCRLLLEKKKHTARPPPLFIGGCWGGWPTVRSGSAPRSASICPGVFSRPAGWLLALGMYSSARRTHDCG